MKQDILKFTKKYFPDIKLNIYQSEMLKSLSKSEPGKVILISRPRIFNNYRIEQILKKFNNKEKSIYETNR